ncbi:MAG: acyl-CoA thioesterase [Saprospiraceae bacterium]|nr:acyl-CoA thioesterase [Saprospiraceae bacterium]
MYVFDYDIRVRYAETDKMGYLFYGHYANYYEIGRVEAFRALGLRYKTMEDDHNIMMPVVNMDVRYIAPAYYDETIKVRSTLKELPTKMITFDHELFNSEDKLINKARVKLFFVDMLSGERISAPEYLVQALLKYFDD